MERNKNILISFLNSVRASGDVYNFVGMKPSIYVGKYNIDAFSEDKFWQYYNQQTTIGPVSIAEKPLPQSIPRLDVDIKRKINTDEIYKREQIVQLIKIANNIFKKYISIEDSLLSCFVLEKDALRIGKYYKRGVHIQWPLFCINRTDMAMWVNEIKENVDKINLFNLEKSPIDLNSYDVPWLIYGACKPIRDSVKSEPYQLSFVVNHPDYDINNVEWLIDQIIIRNVENDVVKEPLSRLMSIQPHGRPVFVFNVNTNNILYIEQKQNKLNFHNTSPNTTAEVEEIKEILDFINIERCENYTEWWQVGSAIYTASSGSKEGFEIWDDWSKNCCEKYSQAQCILVWKSLKITSYGIGMLKKYARDDNATLYEDYKKKKLLAQFSNSEKNKNQTSSVIADICKNILGDVYVACPVNELSNTKKWYKFYNNKWNVENFEIIKKTVESSVKNEILKMVTETPNTDEKRLRSKFEEPSSLNNIMSMLELKYLDGEFMDKLDKNVEIIGFMNGIYDLDKCIFRDGQPTDYVSFSLNCSYDASYSFEHYDILKVEEILESFFPVKEIRDYMLDILAHVFIGNKRFKNLFIWIGTGDNGKSVFTKWISKMLGPEYSITLQTTILSSNKSKPGQATPEFSVLKNKRLAIFHEPDHGEKLTSGNLKMLTGKDEILTRALYQSPETIIPVAIYVLVTNHEPKLSNPDDQATWNRFRVCEFPSTFLDDDEKVPKTREERVNKKIFPALHDFEETLYKLNDALAWYLIERWKRVKNTKVNTPQMVSTATRRYRDNNNVLIKFISDYYETSENFVNFENFYNKFREIYSTSRFNEKSKLFEELQKMNFVIQDGKILNLSSKDNNSNVQNVYYS